MIVRTVFKKYIFRVSALTFIFLSLFYQTQCNKNKEYRILNTPVSVKDKYDIIRNYKLYIWNKTEKMSLLVYFHGVMSKGFKKIPTLKGYTGSPVEETGLIEFCKTNEIALLVPKAAYTYKFLDCKSYGWSPFNKEINGIERIIDTVVSEYNINRKKIFLAGISAGGVLVHHLANRRPSFYNSILSHSQGYISEDNRQLKPQQNEEKFGVVICYTRGDYKNLIPICENTHRIYKEAGFKTVLLRNLKPLKHSWDASSNRLFWRMLLRTGQYPVEQR
jgi:predicted peptidase